MAVLLLLGVMATTVPQSNDIADMPDQLGTTFLNIMLFVSLLPLAGAGVLFSLIGCFCKSKGAVATWLTLGATASCVTLLALLD